MNDLVEQQFFDLKNQLRVYTLERWNYTPILEQGLLNYMMIDVLIITYFFYVGCNSLRRLRLRRPGRFPEIAIMFFGFRLDD